MSFFGFNRKKGKGKGPATLEQLGDLVDRATTGFRRLASNPRLSSASIATTATVTTLPRENTRHDDDDKTPDLSSPATPVPSR